MWVPIDTVVTCFRLGVVAIAILAMGLGTVSVWAPRRSIVLYQRIMAWFNWRVSPLDEARELRNTRRLGVTLLILSVVLASLVCRYRG